MAEDAHLTQLDKPSEESTDPIGKFKISKTQLSTIAYACQVRNFAEEIDKLEELGGEAWLQDGLWTSYAFGLSNDDDFKERIDAFGHNKKPIREPKSYLELVWNGLQDFTIKILIVAAVASIAIDVGTASDSNRSIAWVEGFAILMAVVISVNATAINDYQKERQFQKLNNVADERKRITVIRGGKNVDIHQSEVLVGDVVQIFEGMEIPADGFVIEASELTSDESAMTGETDPVKKNTLAVCKDRRDQLRQEGSEVIQFQQYFFFFLNQNTSGPHEVPSPIMMSGTRVLTGEGKMLILVVGDLSCVGKISALLRSDEEEVTPLQMKLAAIAEDIGKFGSWSALVIVLVMLLRFAIERGQQGDWDDKYIGEILNYFIIGITVIVVAIPEGLPLAVTLSLAFSAKQMLADQNLVRKMAACETMGGASMICSDKTGTLTQNKMTLVNVWNDEIIEIDAYSPSQKIEQYMSKEFSVYFIQAAIINSSAMLKPEPKGSKTEIALLEFITRCNIDFDAEKLKYPQSLKFPFSSARKRMSMVLELEGGHRRLVCKGASELVMQACSQYHSKSGSIQPLTGELKSRIEQAIEKMAGKALRTICFAYKDLSMKEDLTTKDSKGVFNVETRELTLLGILGIKDVLRQEVPKAIRQCRMAGIKVRMVTGDNKLTAQAIAKECGIIQPGDDNEFTVVEGPIFMEKIGGVVCKVCRTGVCPCPRDQTTAKQENKEIRVDTIFDGPAFDKIYPQICVMARSRPEDKYALVTGLIERGHVVAVTGDGTNDAPALKKADVGFAMGIAGTEVAREAAAIILLDDNFNSIVKAVMWGRNVYDNIRKFIRFQLTANVVAVGLTLVGAAILRQEILRPIQMLWVNLIMDTLGSLALATEPPNEKLLNRKPHDRNEYIVNRTMFKQILGTSAAMITVVLIIVFAGDSFLPEYEDGYDQSVYSGNKAFYKYSDTDHDPFNFNLTSTSAECSGKNYYNCFCKHLTQCTLLKVKQCDFNKFCTKVGSGREHTVSGEYEYYWFYEQSYEPSRHFTYVFNVFIMMQIFNFINSRRFGDELNVFEGMSQHTAFMIIVPGIFLLQIILVTFGSTAIGLYTNFGLIPVQWCICVGFGAITLLACFFLKFIKEDLCCECGKKQINPLDMEERGVLNVKGNHSQNGLRRRYSSMNPHGHVQGHPIQLPQ